MTSDELRFGWDEAKSERNKRKRGFDFDDARLVFYDPHVVFLEDRVIDGEERMHALGVAGGIGILVVVFMVRGDEQGEIIHIISARLATAREKRLYYASL